MKSKRNTLYTNMLSILREFKIFNKSKQLWLNYIFYPVD